MLPDFWRTEIWHPLSVHFPIVLLLGATLTRVIAVSLRSRSSNDFWLKLSRLTLFLGVVTVWVSYYTGILAYEEIGHTLCDPTVMHDHELFSLYTSWIYTIVLVVDLITMIPAITLDFLKKTAFQWLMVLVLIAGAGFLSYTGHLGATLVYQQAAGVYVPAENCREFE